MLRNKKSRIQEKRTMKCIDQHSLMGSAVVIKKEKAADIRKVYTQ